MNRERALGRTTMQDEGEEERSSAAPLSGENEVLFDRSALMRRIGQNADLLRELLSLFVEVQPKEMGELRQAVDARDAPRTKRLAHKIAGSFASLAMNALARRAMDIERRAATGDVGSCAGLMAELEACFGQVLEELEPRSSGALTG